MRTKIFVDTLFLVALINKRDQYHQKALALAQQFESYSLIIEDEYKPIQGRLLPDEFVV